MTAKTMKIRVSLTVEIDPETWSHTYGDEPETRAEWADEIRRHILNDIAGSSAAEAGAIVEVIETHH